MPEDMTNEILKMPVLEAWELYTIKLYELKDSDQEEDRELAKEMEEKYKKIRYGIKTKFDLATLNEELLYSKAGGGVAIVMHKQCLFEINIHRFESEMEERRSIIKSLLIRALQLKPLYAPE